MPPTASTPDKPRAARASAPSAPPTFRQLVDFPEYQAACERVRRVADRARDLEDQLAGPTNSRLSREADARAVLDGVALDAPEAPPDRAALAREAEACRRAIALGEQEREQALVGVQREMARERLPAHRAIGRRVAAALRELIAAVDEDRAFVESFREESNGSGALACHWSPGGQDVGFFIEFGRRQLDELERRLSAEV